MQEQFRNLLSPLKIGSVTIKNRFAVAPMAIGNYVGSHGEYTPQGIEYFVQRAKGGFGLMFTGAHVADTEIDPYNILGESPLKAPNVFRKSAIELNSRVRSYGTHMFAQITMGLGRNYPGLYSPSVNPVYSMPDQKSPELSKEQIKRKIELVVQTAALMKSSGFSGVEVHSIHWGYLLDQFAMSLTNRRTDEYGGSLENRLRAAKEILEGIKQECGSDFPVTMRLGLQTYVKDFDKATLTGEEEAGRTLEEGVRISKLLETYGYDALNVDTGIYDSFYYACPPMYLERGYMIDIAAAAKKEVNIPILTGSRMNVPNIAEKAIAEGKMDAIVLGRASLADPEFPRKIEMSRPDKIRPCIACNQACQYRLLGLGVDACCAVNPAAGRELYYGLEEAVQPKKVVVVGGGVSGMEAARVAKMRGHEVSLYEKTNSLGGHLVSGGAHSFKSEVRELNEWYKQELQDLKVDIHMDEEVGVDQIRNMKADTVILAVGSTAIMPKLQGMDNPKVVSCIEALNGNKKVGDKIVIVGGGLVGCEMALEYIQEGKQVTIVEALDAILSAGEAVPIPNKQMLVDLFEYHKTPIKTGYKIIGANDIGAVIAPTAGGQEEVLEADSIIIAVGFKPRASIAEKLMEKGAAVYQIGDGNRVGNIQWAIWEAYEVAKEL